MSRLARRLSPVACCLLLLSGCLAPRYLAQAGYGQLDLLSRRRPLEEVIADPSVPVETRQMLAVVPEVRAFGAKHGLSTTRNYRHYVELRGGAAVWFVGAAPPLSFEAKRWCFPIAGCFTGLGWFDEDEALRHRDQLRRDGWDAMARPASAYSTGGWFPDPVISPMIERGDGALEWLVNVILHESVHATVLIKDQMFFNEAFAEYIGDVLTDQWLVERYGKDSKQRATFAAGQVAIARRTELLLATYRELDALYKSKLSDAVKRERKAAIYARLGDQLRTRADLNNAVLVEVRLYRADHTVFARAHEACGSVAALVAAAGRLGAGDFDRKLQEDLTAPMQKVIARCSARPASSRGRAPA